MLEAKYYRDYRHNYMILRCGREVASRSYQYKILTSGKISEILKCSVRHMNGATYYYYDISSRTTLDSLYRDKAMSGRQVKDVLWQLHGICGKLSGYFMEETALVLLPEHIYYDLANQKYIGLYYPDYHTEPGAAYRPLMDFLLEHIDTQDQQLTEDMYRICEICEEPCFSIEDALQILEEEEPERTELVEISTTLYETGERIASDGYSGREKKGQPENVSGADDKENGTRANERADDIRLFDSQSFDGRQDNKILCAGNIYGEEIHGKNCNSARSNEKSGSGQSRIYPVCAVTAALGIAGAYAVRSLYQLTQEEEIALYGAIAVMTACFIICLAGYVRGRKKGGAGSKKERDNTGKSQSVEYDTESEVISLEHVLDKDMSLRLAASMPASCQTEAPAAVSGHGAMSFAGSGPTTAQGNHACGNTVFFDTNKVAECKLYAVDKKNKRHIELKQFPCTVGKMAGCVDYVLPDDSVSRIHARFDKKGEKILLTDMNSTNGTYKNGLRMQPQETVEIEPGDEVRFGNLNYCYR